MPKRGATALALTALALVLLLNFREPAGVDPTGSTGTVDRSGAIAGAPAAGGPAVTPRPAATPEGPAVTPDDPAQAAAQTVAGPVVSTRWGSVQVAVTLESGRITDVQALQLPDGDRRSASISQRAEPVLRSQALQAQGAAIDGISGATYTSIAYARSLQAALDSAGT
jgi:uncharacterized protein with FMN-binding domain